MKLYALLLGILLSCTCYGVVTYKCEKDEIVYQMDGYELSLFKGILYDDRTVFLNNGLRGFNNLWMNANYIIDVPAVLMIFENDKKFLDIIYHYSIFQEMFPELCIQDTNVVQSQFDIHERDICVEGQNQKLLSYLKEKYDIWKKTHTTNVGTETLHKSFLSGNIPGRTSFGEEEIIVPNYYGTSTESVDVPTPVLAEELLSDELKDNNLSDSVFTVSIKK